MSNTNYQAMGGEGNVPPPAYAPTAPSAEQPPQYQQQGQPPAYQQPVVVTQPAQAVPQRAPVTASGALPPQYAQVQPNNSNPPSYAYPIQQQTQPLVAQQPIIVKPVAIPQQQTTTVVVARPVYGANNNGNRGYPAGNQYGGAQPVGVVEPYQDLTLLSCLACFFCGWICGLGALMFSSNAQAAHRRGDYDEYRRQNSNAKMCLIISVVVGVVFWGVIMTTVY